MPKVNPAVLAWARESSGLTVEEAAAKLGINQARGVAAADRLAKLERGEDAPTRNMLAKMAKQYRRPLLAFYMSAPPRKGDRGEDFRTLPQQQAGPANSLVDTLVRGVRAKQNMVRSLLEEAGEAQRLDFIASAALGGRAADLARSISQTIRVTSEQYHGAANVDEAFATLRGGTEAAGVFVLLMGNLGSHHTAIDVDTFRGFAIADQVAPFVVINDQDARTAWAFTLVHELAHLWLGATGISGLYGESRLERYCNEVASELLLPRQHLVGVGATRNMAFDDLRVRITNFAGVRNLSASMVAYRLYTADIIEFAMWEQLRAFFRRQWQMNREVARAEAREQEGGPNYYVVRRHRVGNALLQVARRGIAEGFLTPTKAATLLGVKPMAVYELLATAAAAR